MIYLVTGAAGFIGSHTVDRLLDDGHRVIGVDNFCDFYSPDFKEENVRAALRHPGYTLHRVDIRNAAALRSAVGSESIDCIIHLAAQAGIPYSTAHPVEATDVNDMGTLQVFELAREFGVPKVIYASSSSVYGDSNQVPFMESADVNRPISLYAANKKSNELLAHVYHHLHGVQMIGLRFFTVYGERGRPDMAPYKFASMIAKNEELTRYGDGSMERDFTYVGDVVSGIMACTTRSLDNEVINIGNSQSVTLQYFIETLEDLMGRKARIVELPVPASDVHKTCADISKARELLGWEPQTNLRDGLERFITWFNNERSVAAV